MGGGRRSRRISILAAIAVLGVIVSTGGALAQPTDPPATTAAPTTTTAAPADQQPATTAPAPPTTTSPSAHAPANAPAQAATAGVTAAAGPLQLADLSVTKTGPGTATPGTDFSYAITVTNNGPDTSQNVSLTDVVPGFTTFVSFTQNSGPAFGCALPAVGGSGTVACTIASLSNGSSAAFTLTVHLNPDVTGGQIVSNFATVNETTADTNTGNNTARADTTALVSSDVSVTTTGPATASPNTDISYLVTVTNSGPSSASVVLDDSTPFSAGFVSFSQNSGPAFGCTVPPVGTQQGNVNCNSVGLMPPGTSSVFTLTVHVHPLTPDGTVITNTAGVHVVGGSFDPNNSNDSSSASTTVSISADIAVMKTVDNPSPNVGNNVTFTVTAKNNGPLNATGVVVTDPLPAGLTFVSASASQGGYTSGSGVWSVGSLASGATATLQIVATVTQAGPHTNTATKTAEDQQDPNAANDSASAVVNGQQSDLSLTKTDAPDPVAPGADLTYTITVTNNGPSSAQNVTVNDTLPTGTTFGSATPSQGSCAGTTTVSCALGSIANGASATITLVVHVGPSVADGTVISNTASVSSTTADPTPANNSATSTTTVTTSADLGVTKADSPDPVTAGTDLTYTIGITNTGPSDAPGVTLTDPIPAGTSFVSATPSTGSCAGTTTVSCNLGTLANGASASATLTVHVGSAVAAGTVLSNTATASSGVSDPNASNDSATATTTVVTSGDLSITKTGSPDPVAAGGDLTYTITVTNNGPSDANNITVTDALPAGTTFGSTASSTGSCAGTATVTCTIASIPNGASATITLVVHVDPTTPPGTVISNTASVSSPAEVTAATADPNPGNNSATATTTVAAAAEVPGSPTEPGSPATPGSPAGPVTAGVGAGSTAGAAAAAVPVVANPTFTG
jgi:large repetitive protein